MAGRELLGRAERAISYVDALARRFAALEGAVRDMAAAHEKFEHSLGGVAAGLAEVQSRTACLEAALQPANCSMQVPENRLQDYSLAIRDLQDRIVRLERTNRELAIRLEQLRGQPAKIQPIAAASA